MDGRFSIGSSENGSPVFSFPPASPPLASSVSLTSVTTNDENEVNNSSCCTSRLGQLVNNQKFSDVTLIVGGRRYYGHRLLLSNASYVLEQMLTSQSWIDSGQSELILLEDGDCCEVFEDFLRYVYTCRVKLTKDTVLGLLVLSDKYNVSDLKESCSAYMKRHLVGPADWCRAVVWYQYALACNSFSLQQACLDYIVLNAGVVVQSGHWVCLDAENLIVILRRSDLVIESEYAVLKAVIRWLADESRLTQLTANLCKILPFVRFPMILPEHLAEFEESTFQQDHHEAFASHLLTAYRYHALSLKGRRLDGTSAASGSEMAEKTGEVPAHRLQFLYRNYTDESYSIYVEVVRKAILICPRLSSKVERVLNLPTTVCNANGSTDGGQCKMKLTFYPQGFYTTSLWNGQLNLAKSTDQTKMVISHRGGMELRRVEITVAVCARRNSTLYIDRATTVEHTFNTYSTCEIDNVVELDHIRAEDSPLVVDGALLVKVFLRPLSFNENVVAPL